MTEEQEQKPAVEKNPHIYNPVPIYMGDKPGALTVDYGVAYFTLESREEAAAILDSIRQHAPFEGEFTRGLYFKGTN